MAHPQRNPELDCVVLAAGQQVCFLPALPLQFLGDDPLRLGTGQRAGLKQARSFRSGPFTWAHYVTWWIHFRYTQRSARDFGLANLVARPKFLA